MIQKLEAHIDDYEKFRAVEEDILRIILAWNEVLANSDMLDADYKLGSVSNDVSISVKFHEPQVVESESGKT